MRPGVLLPDTCSNYYELLGLAPFECDVQVINLKVRELMREARKYQVGQYAAQAERHLNLLASATACLSNPRQKQDYDDQLRQQWGLPPVSVTAALPQETAAIPTGPASPARFKSLVFAAAAASLLLVVGLAVRMSGTPDPKAPSDSTSENLADSQLTTETGPAPAADLVAASLRPDGGALQPRAAGSANVRSQPGTTQPAPTGLTEKSGPGGASAGAQTKSTPVATNRPTAIAAASKPIMTTDEESSNENSPANATPAPTAFGTDTPQPGRSPAAEPKPPVALEFDLSGAEVIRELKSLRLKRGAAGDSAWRQAQRLVRYGYAAFPDDKRFMRQLQVEITALRRVFPQLRDSLRDVPR